MNPVTLRRVIAAALFIPAYAGAQTVPAHPALNDRFYFGVGAFFPRTSTSPQLQSRTGARANIDFENALVIATGYQEARRSATWTR